MRYKYFNTKVEWPSGLRRQVKALISSEARVQIPSQPNIINFFYAKITVNLSVPTFDIKKYSVFLHKKI